MFSFRLLFFLMFGIAGADLNAHGGIYLGPGDVVPPQNRPANPSPPSAIPGTPLTPRSPLSPPSPSYPQTPQSPKVGRIPSTRIGIQSPRDALIGCWSYGGKDLSSWEFWWEINKARFINLKAHVHRQEVVSMRTDVLVGLEDGAFEDGGTAPTTSQIRNLVLPELLQTATWENNSQDFSSALLMALAKTGEQDLCRETLIQHLSHPRQEITETAAIALGVLGDPQALPHLRHVLFDTEVARKDLMAPNGVPIRTRTFAAYALGLLAHRQEQTSVRDQVAEWLWESLLAAPSERSDLDVACVLGLGMSRPDDLSQWVRRLRALAGRKEVPAPVRAHALTALAKLVKAHDYPEPYAKSTALFLLQILQDKTTENVILQSCVQALGLALPGNHSLAPEVITNLTAYGRNGADRQARHYTAISLAYLGATAPSWTWARERVLDFLIEQVHRGSTGYRPWACLALGVLAFDSKANHHGRLPRSVAAALLNAFQSRKNPRERSACALALGLMQLGSAKEPVFLTLRENQNPTFRGYLAVALGLLQAREYADDIRFMAQNAIRLPDFLQQCALSMGLLQDRKAVPMLIGILKKPQGQPLSVLSATATALGHIGDRRAVRPLLNLLEGGELTSLGRAFVVAALGQVIDRNQLPWNNAIGADINYAAAVPTLVSGGMGTGVLEIL